MLGLKGIRSEWNLDSGMCAVYADGDHFAENLIKTSLCAYKEHLDIIKKDLQIKVKGKEQKNKRFIEGKKAHGKKPFARTAIAVDMVKRLFATSSGAP